MARVVSLFKSFTIIFYLKFLKFGKDAFGSNQFKSFFKYSNKLGRVQFSLGLARFPSSPAGPCSLGVAHAPDSLLPYSQTTPNAARLCRSRVLSVARPPPSPPFPPSVPAQRSHHAPSPFLPYPSCSVPLTAARAPPLPLVLVTETPTRHCRPPGTPDSMKNSHRPAPHGELHPPDLPICVEVASHLPLCPPVAEDPSSPPVTTRACRRHRKHYRRSPFQSPHHHPTCSVSHFAILLARRSRHGPMVP
jgi:hypothetical protein